MLEMESRKKWVETQKKIGRKQISFWVDDELIQAMNRILKEHGATSRTEFITISVIEKINRYHGQSQRDSTFDMIKELVDHISRIEEDIKEIKKKLK